MGKKINLKLYDVDGCLYHGFREYLIEFGVYKKPVEEWLIESNEKFLNAEVESIKSGQYNKVVIAYGTNRQSYVIDRENQFRGGTCAPVLPLMQSYLRKNVGCDVVLDPFLMADIYGNKESGESYKAILNEKYSGSKNEKHSSWMFDRSKISLIYAHACRITVLDREENEEPSEIVIDFYDDSLSIIKHVHDFFRENHKLLLKNVTLRIHQYENGHLSMYKNEIKGTGSIVDEKYDWSVRYLASKSCRYSGEAKKYDNHVNTAEMLEKFDQKCRDMPIDRMEMNVELDFEVEEFIKFREKEISRLELNANITKKSNYTTAAELKESKLIPNEYDLGALVKAEESKPLDAIVPSANEPKPQDKLAEYVNGLINPVTSGIDEYCKKERTGSASHLSIFSQYFDKNRGLNRARLYGEALKDPELNSLNKLLIIYALLASHDGVTLKKDVNNAMKREGAPDIENIRSHLKSHLGDAVNYYQGIVGDLVAFANNAPNGAAKFPGEVWKPQGPQLKAVGLYPRM